MRVLRPVLFAALVVAATTGCDDLTGFGRRCGYVDLVVPGTLIDVGDELKFKAWVQDEDPDYDCRAYEGEDITWRSSNPNVADVDRDGWVYGVSTGRAQIRAINDRSGRESSVTVTVVRR